MLTKPAQSARRARAGTADLACQPAKLSVRAATVLGADTANPAIETADPVGRPIADNNICQSGTTCVVTGQDRRLGDYFTNNLDRRGCVIIATADTTEPAPISQRIRAWGLPLFPANFVRICRGCRRVVL